jgi:hypothetical protein
MMSKLLTVALLLAAVVLDPVVLDPASAHFPATETSSPASLRTADDGRLLLQVASAASTSGLVSNPAYELKCWFLFHKAWC